MLAVWSLAHPVHMSKCPWVLNPKLPHWWMRNNIVKCFENQYGKKALCKYRPFMSYHSSNASQILKICNTDSHVGDWLMSDHQMKLRSSQTETSQACTVCLSPVIRSAQNWLISNKPEVTPLLVCQMIKCKVNIKDCSQESNNGVDGQMYRSLHRLKSPLT